MISVQCPYTCCKAGISQVHYLHGLTTVIFVLSRLQADLCPMTMSLLQVGIYLTIVRLLSCFSLNLDYCLLSMASVIFGSGRLLFAMLLMFGCPPPPEGWISYGPIG